MKTTHITQVSFVAAVLCSAAIGVQAQRVGRGYVPISRPTHGPIIRSGSGGAATSPGGGGGIINGPIVGDLGITWFAGTPQSPAVNGNSVAGTAVNQGVPMGLNTGGFNTGQTAMNNAAAAQLGMLRGVNMTPYAPGTYGFGYPSYIGMYGGGYGYGDPAFAVTPYGLQPVGDGYGGYNTPSAPNWDMLRAIYAQGYQDAANAAAANAYADNAQASVPSGMTATPRGAVSRVPHGNDGVRVSRVGRGEMSLRWQGDPSTVSSVTFELVDSSLRPLRRTTVDQLPAEARFTPSPSAAFYQVIVHYIDGATNTIMGRVLK